MTTNTHKIDVVYRAGTKSILVYDDMPTDELHEALRSAFRTKRAVSGVQVGISSCTQQWIESLLIIF